MSDNEKVKAVEESIVELLMKSDLDYADALVALFKAPKLFEKKMENKIRNKVVTEAEAEAENERSGKE